MMMDGDEAFMFVRILTHGPHTRQFTIRDAGDAGWEVREQQDDRITREVHYTDWHRVERALAGFELEAALLERDGWRAERTESGATAS
jgi:hypothetical protein